MRDIGDFLLDEGAARITVTFGWECHLPIAELWRPIEIETQSLQDFVADHTRQGVFRAGQNDLHIEDLERKIEFRLCHESDLHFESDVPGHAQRVIDMWRTKGFKVFVAKSPRRSALPKHWTPIG